MTIVRILALLLTPDPPLPLTDLQMRDIGCVAVIGIIAHEQRSGGDAITSYPDVRETGKRWAGIVGDRVMEESGQPREVVALAIKTAVEAEQEKAMRAASAEAAAAHVKTRFDECKAIMDAQLAAADTGVPVTAIDDTPSMLAAEKGWNTDEPETLALYRQQLGEDLKSPRRMIFCAGLIGAARLEIVEREGEKSRDALAMQQRMDILLERANTLPKPEETLEPSRESLKQSLQKEEEKEEQFSRCFRLSESLALALPPE